jgi:hypothetical protein
MILYGCTDDFDQSKIGTVEDCASMNPSCTTFMIAWAPGGALVNYPREAGFPIGTGVNAIKYFALQACAFFFSSGLCVQFISCGRS